MCVGFAFPTPFPTRNEHSGQDSEVIGIVQKEMTDLQLLEELLGFTRVDRKPSNEQLMEFSKLKDELENRLKKEMCLEKRTCRLIRCLKAA